MEPPNLPAGRSPEERRGEAPIPCEPLPRTLSSPLSQRFVTTLSSDGGPERRAERQYLRFAGTGIQFAVTIVLFTLGGIWLDGKVEGLRPLFTVLGLLLGFLGATASLIFQVLGTTKKKKE